MAGAVAKGALPGFGEGKGCSREDCWGRMMRVRDASFGTGYSHEEPCVGSVEWVGVGSLSLAELLRYMPATPVVGKEPPMVIIEHIMPLEVT